MYSIDPFVLKQGEHVTCSTPSLVRNQEQPRRPAIGALDQAPNSVLNTSYLNQVFRTHGCVDTATVFSKLSTGSALRKLVKTCNDSVDCSQHLDHQEMASV